MAKLQYFLLADNCFFGTLMVDRRFIRPLHLRSIEFSPLVTALVVPPFPRLYDLDKASTTLPIQPPNLISDKPPLSKAATKKVIEAATSKAVGHFMGQAREHCVLS